MINDTNRYKSGNDLVIRVIIQVIGQTVVQSYRTSAKWDTRSHSSLKNHKCYFAYWFKAYWIVKCYLIIQDAWTEYSPFYSYVCAVQQIFSGCSTTFIDLHHHKKYLLLVTICYHSVCKLIIRSYIQKLSNSSGCSNICSSRGSSIVVVEVVIV